MSTYIQQSEFETRDLVRVWSVEDFVRLYGIEQTEKKRLICLLGEFASESELRMNARRRSKFR